MAIQAQNGSHFSGVYNVTGSLHQGNVINYNIYNTADICLMDLHITDPREDKKRIQDTKGGLLADSYIWVFQNAEFCQWRDDEGQRLLWVKGDPGKGKTMLLCGIIDKLEEDFAETPLSYFFCQATDNRINSATSVLRGLICKLCCQDTSLVFHIKKRYDTAGKKIFEDFNAWYTLKGLFTDMLGDPKLRGVCLVVDALDECVAGLDNLLDLIVTTSKSTRAKWLISSRNWPQIQEKLCNVAQRLSLEVNEESVTTAIEVYINHKLSQLTKCKGYPENTANNVRQYLLSNAKGTFLWVALVCQELEKSRRGNALQKLQSFPSGLNALYQRMMEQIHASEDAELCEQVLALVATTYRPPSLAESTIFIEECRSLAGNAESVKEIVGFCGSFLTIRNETVYFVHQSAEDFLIEKQSSILFPQTQASVHRKIFSESIKTMSQKLERDIYKLHDPGFPIKHISQRVPRPDPLSAINYSCINWISHLVDASQAPGGDNYIQEDEAVVKFLQSKCLYWIEALSLLRNMSEGMHTLQRLRQHLQDQSRAPVFQALVKDTYRLLQTFRVAIESYPLQAYTSVLMFSPIKSLMRGMFYHEGPRWVTSRMKLVEQWSACEMTLEGHTGRVRSAAFSADGRHVVSTSDDHTVKLWDAATGECKTTLNGHHSSVSSAAFSDDRRYVVSASDDHTVKLWDVATGACEATLEGHTSAVRSAAFSVDGQCVVSASHDYTVKLWDAVTGMCKATLEGHTDWVTSAAFSADGQCVVSASRDNTVKLWDAAIYICKATLTGHTMLVTSAAFSVDGRRVVSASHDKTIKLWDMATGDCKATLEGHRDWVTSAAFSADGRRVVSASRDCTVRLWDVATGTCLYTYNVGYTSTTVSLDVTGTVIHTNAGRIYVDESMLLNAETDLQKAGQQKDYSLSPDRAWILKQSKEILWLPPEYRSTVSAVSATEQGTNFVLGYSSCRVYIFHLGI